MSRQVPLTCRIVGFCLETGEHSFEKTATPLLADVESAFRGYIEGPANRSLIAQRSWRLAIMTGIDGGEEMSGTGLTQKELLQRLPQVGTVKWIGLRTERRGQVDSVDQVEASTIEGLVGDRFFSKSNLDRQVTLIQAEHLAAVGHLLAEEPIDPMRVRRNIVVSGINLLALKRRDFRVGNAILRWTGLCHPCSRMEEVLGPGGYNAMRGHGGITAQVIQSGSLRVGDEVAACDDGQEAEGDE